MGRMRDDAYVEDVLATALVRARGGQHVMHEEAEDRCAVEVDAAVLPRRLARRGRQRSKRGNVVGRQQPRVTRIRRSNIGSVRIPDPRWPDDALDGIAKRHGDRMCIEHVCRGPPGQRVVRAVHNPHWRRDDAPIFAHHCVRAAVRRKRRGVHGHCHAAGQGVHIAAQLRTPVRPDLAHRFGNRHRPR
jgi:hypothetical protein